MAPESGCRNKEQIMISFFYSFLTQYSCSIAGSLLAGYVLDLILGDPHCLWHPIRLTGRIISGLEGIIRKRMPETARGDFRGGICLVVLTLICSAGIPLAVLAAGYAVSWWLGFGLQCYMCYTILATKSLKTESMKVYKGLESGGLEAGRQAVSMIVGRDTGRLDETGVIKAAVETVAENTSDGVIAPMIYMAVGGPVLGFFYKGVNTMDSMVGYKNDRYLYFGRAAARLDDLVNYLPSRISALFMILGCCFLPGEQFPGGLRTMDRKRAWKVWKRDRRKHASPNSAQTESVMAGALGIRLAGDAWYSGEKYEKPFIGDALRAVEKEDIFRAGRLLYATSATGMVVCLGIRFFLVHFPVIVL